ncbi:MAG TPA: ABC transporter substrate-binding protein [Thermomicrobiales bacterium]|nr:ABC transporter substrate-binding protein [Thermomicrobiales bacterium]
MTTYSDDEAQRFHVISERTLRVLSSRRRFLGGAAAGLGGALALTNAAGASGTRGASAGVPRDQDALEIIIGTLGEADQINPFRTSDSEGDWRAAQLFDELIRVDPVSYAPVPGLASEFTVNGTTLDIKLQPNAKFSDGSDLTADDVAFTIMGHLTPATGSIRATKYLSIQGAQEFMDGKATEVSGIKVIDPKSLQLTFTEPDAAILYNLRYIRPVPKAQLEGKDLANDPWFQNPVGAGPFKFESWTTDADFVMTRNEHFWESGKPAITKVTHRVIADAQSLVLALLGDEIDGSNYPSPTGKDELEKNENLAVMVPPFSSPNGWTFNCRQGPLAKKEVRKAIAMALNNEQFAADSLLGLGKAGLGPIAPDSWAFDKNLQPIPFDVEGAKKLVQEAGAEGAKIRFMVNSGNIQREDWLTYTQQALQEIGIEVVPETIEYATLVDRSTKSHDFDATNGDICGVTAEPSELFDQFHSTGAANHTGFSTPELDKLLEQVQVTVDIEKAKPLYAEIQKILMDEVPVDWAWYRPFLHTVNKKWTGYTDSGNEGLFYTLKDWTAAS